MAETGGFAAPGEPDGFEEISAEAFAAGFGEPLDRALDVKTWSLGHDLAALYTRLDEEVRTAVAHEHEYCRHIRESVFPRLVDYDGAPPGAGVHQTSPAGLEYAHRHLLFAGLVDGCDGTSHRHDTLPLTIHQLGVSLTNYSGDQGAWTQRLFRRDLRLSMADPTEELVALLERRERRDAVDAEGRRDRMSELANRGIMTYAERAILLRQSKAPWRIGHGSPAPLELVTGAGNLELMVAGTRVVRELVEGHRQFLFVASEPRERLLLSVGQALRPGEYAVVRTLREQTNELIAMRHFRGFPAPGVTWDGQRLSHADWIVRFRDEVASQVVVGVYRASAVAPPHVFYAHVDHAEEAAHLAIADSRLQEHRGFPLLIDLADAVCQSALGPDTLTGPVAAAYAGAGTPWRYQSERATRGRR